MFRVVAVDLTNGHQLTPNNNTPLLTAQALSGTIFEQCLVIIDQTTRHVFSIIIILFDRELIVFYIKPEFNVIIQVVYTVV